MKDEYRLLILYGCLAGLFFAGIILGRMIEAQDPMIIKQYNELVEEYNLLVESCGGWTLTENTYKELYINGSLSEENYLREDNGSFTIQR